jgi:hypothetical protein
MADLKIGTSIDLGPLGKLGEASKQVASNLDAMAERFVKSGLTAKEAASALTNMGYSASSAAAAVKAFSTATAGATAQTVAATTSVDGLTRALAAGGVRIASTELGVGQLGFALGRVGAASSLVAPALAVAFPVFAATALVDVVDRAYTKLRELGLEAMRNAEGWEKIDHSENVAFETLDRQIERADDKIVELTSGKLAAMQLELRQIGDGAVEMASRMTSLFDAMGTQLEKEEPLFDKIKSFLFTIESRGLVLPNQGELAKAFGADLAKTLDTQGLSVGIEQVSRQIAIVNKELSATPGDKQLQEYAAQLIKILGLLEERRTLETKETAVKGLEIQKEHTAEIERSSEAGIKLFEAMDRIKAKQEEAAKSAAELQRAQSAFAAEQAVKSARTMEDAWAAANQARTRGEEEALRASERTAESNMRNVKAQESLATAGLNKGPITSILEGTSLKEQGAVAASAMEEAKSAAADYQSQLDAVQLSMAGLNRDTEEGAHAFKDLEADMLKLQTLFDSAKMSADRWAGTLKQIQAAQAQNAKEMGFSMENIKTNMENAAQSGFQAFNSAFLRMAAGGMSFARVLQSLWTAMVDSFITAVLKMAEYYIMKYVIMAAMAKIFGQTAAASATSDIALKEADRQASIGTAAATAAIEAAWAGPGAAIAAAAEVEAALQGITSFAQGGIVKANLHEGEMVLPAHISTFIQTAAAGAMGAPGGPGGPGGRGGAGGAAGHTFIFNHNGDGSPSEMRAANRDFSKQIMRELRRLNLI